MTLENKVKTFLAEYLHKNPDDLNQDTLLIDDLGIDPYDLDNLVENLARQWDIRFDPEEVEQLNTFSDLIKIISDKV